MQRASLTYPSLCCYGLALAYAWRSFAVSDFDAPTETVLLVRAASYLVFAVSLHLLDLEKRRTVLMALLAVASLACTLLLGSDNVLLVNGAYCLKEFVFAGAILLWAEFYGTLPYQQASFIVGGSFMGTALVCALINLLPPAYQPGLALLLMPLSLISLNVSHSLRSRDDDIDRTKQSRQKPTISEIPSRFLALSTICAFVTSATLGESSTWIQLVGFALAGLLVFASVFVLLRRKGLYALVDVVAPILLASLALSIALGSTGFSLAAAAVTTNACYALIQAVVFLYFADKNYRFGISAVFYVGIARCLTTVAYEVGITFIALLEKTAESSTEVLLVTHALAFLLVLFAGVIWFADERRTESFALDPLVKENPTTIGPAAEDVRPQDSTAELFESYWDMIKQRCSELSDDYGLSPREEEVLFLLAKGMSFADIEETLFISDNTLKTHARHIYQKMGIHSRKELCALVQSDPNARA